MHTHLVFILSFHTLIALSAFVAWKSLLLALISIDGHLHSPLVSHVDVRPSFFFVFYIFTPIIILYSTHSAISMACAHVLHESWKSWSALKSMNQLLGLSSGLSMARLYDCVGITFSAIDIMKDIIVCWDAWVLMSLYQIICYCFESLMS